MFTQKCQLDGCNVKWIETNNVYIYIYIHIREN